MLIDRYIASIRTSALGRFAETPPWELTAAATEIIAVLLAELGSDYRIGDAIAVHRRAKVETGATLKPPLIIGPNCFVAAYAYLRGGCWLEADCVLGLGVEAKSSFLFAGVRLAHFNFVRDSLIGSEVNVEAGAVVANTRNERPDRTVAVREGAKLIETGAPKFGAVIGDHCRIGANAVLSPGTMLEPGSVVPRLALLDQAAPGGA